MFGGCKIKLHIMNTDNPSAAPCTAPRALLHVHGRNARAAQGLLTVPHKSSGRCSFKGSANVSFYAETCRNMCLPQAASVRLRLFVFLFPYSVTHVIRVCQNLI